MKDIVNDCGRQQIGGRGRGIAMVLLASLIAAALSSIGLALLFPLGEERSTTSVLATLVVTSPFCVFGNLLFGLPAFVSLAKLGLIRWWIWIPTSVVTGVFLEFFVRGVQGWDSRDLHVTVPLTLICAMICRLVWAASEHWRSRK